VVARVHALLPPDWDWSGAAAAPPPAAAATGGAPAGGGGGAASEEAREAGDLQRAYYALLLALALNQLAPALLQARPRVLQQAAGPGRAGPSRAGRGSNPPTPALPPEPPTPAWCLLPQRCDARARPAGARRHAGRGAGGPAARRSRPRGPGRTAHVPAGAAPAAGGHRRRVAAARRLPAVRRPRAPARPALLFAARMLLLAACVRPCWAWSRQGASRRAQAASGVRAGRAVRCRSAGPLAARPGMQALLRRCWAQMARSKRVPTAVPWAGRGTAPVTPAPRAAQISAGARGGRRVRGGAGDGPPGRARRGGRRAAGRGGRAAGGVRGPLRRRAGALPAPEPAARAAAAAGPAGVRLAGPAASRAGARCGAGTALLPAPARLVEAHSSGSRPAHACQLCEQTGTCLGLGAGPRPTPPRTRPRQEALLQDVGARDARALRASLRALVLASPGAPPNSRARSSAVAAARQARAVTPSASADSGGMVS